MYMKMFTRSTRVLLPSEALHELENEVNTWVRSTSGTFKVMNISPPTQMFDWISVTVVYVER